MKENYKEKPIVKGTLSEDKAHDMANMMQVKAGVDPHREGYVKLKSGEWVPVDKKEKALPTSEDYKRVSLEIEELERLAVESSPLKEIFSNLKRVILEIPKHSLDLSNRERYEKMIREKMFTAKQKLEQLEKEGAKFEDMKRTKAAFRALTTDIWDIIRVTENGSMIIAQKKEANPDKELKKFAEKF